MSKKAKPMNVLGTEIPQQVIDAAIARMDAGPFRAKEIEDVVAGLMPDSKDDVHMRAADRIIQRERSAGRIELRGSPRRWHRVERTQGEK